MRTAILAALAAALTGCGSAHRDQPTAAAETVAVTGRVTYKGKAVPAGLVRFMAEDSRAEALTRIQKDGTYSVQAPAGKVRVTVDTSSVKDEYDDPAERRKWYVRIPGQYATYPDTPVRLTIPTEGNTLDLALED